MSTPNDGSGQAFPYAAEYGHPASCYGLSKREYFAAMAIQGLIFHNDYGHVSDEDIANGAVSYADALLAALSKEVAP